VDIEAGVFPGEEVSEFAGADEFGIAQGVEEAVAEEFGYRAPVLAAGWTLKALVEYFFTSALLGCLGSRTSG
jgi:hypothetical protein